MQQHHRFYTWVRRHPAWVDAAWVVPLFLLILERSPGYATHPWQLLLALALMGLEWLPLVFRRTHTVGAAGVIAAANFTHLILGLPATATNLSVIPAVYALSVHAPRWARQGGLALALIGSTWSALSPDTSFIAGKDNDPGLWALGFGWAFQSTVILLSWALGDLVRARRMRVLELEERAHRLEVEREQERRLAAFDERSRIAREMHDIIAHSLSVMIAQADGGRYAAKSDPAAAEAALSTIAETGRGSLLEMRRLIGVLRNHDTAETAPLPGLSDMEDLVRNVQVAGVDIDFRWNGEQAGPLPSGAELTVYRVVQEALTNILKHAGPRAKVRLELEWTSRGLNVLVEDDGRGAGADPATSGSQQGLIGMRERMGLYDGTITAGPKPGGGFRVAGRIPYSGAER